MSLPSSLIGIVFFRKKVRLSFLGLTVFAYEPEVATEDGPQKSVAFPIEYFITTDASGNTSMFKKSDIKLYTDVHAKELTDVNLRYDDMHYTAVEIAKKVGTKWGIKLGSWEMLPKI